MILLLLFHNLEINWANISTRSLSRTPEIENILLFYMLILSIQFLAFPTCCYKNSYQSFISMDDRGDNPIKYRNLYQTKRDIESIME